MVATPGFPLVHKPPDELFESVLQEPVHTSVLPAIAVGSGLTEIVVVTMQLPGIV
jgi:hypothetical protein